MDVSRWNLYKYIRDIKDRKVIIFGSDARAEKLYHKLNLIDFKISYFVDDVIEEQMLCGCKVRNYHDLLYENADKIKIVIIEPKNLEKLFKIGLCSKDKLDNCLLLFEYNLLKGVYPLDPTLGYNILGDAEYHGFVSFGDRETKYTIVTLGGSTTDAFYAAYATKTKIKSWSEILADKLKKEGISAKILCGGVAGYKSSQELLKLIRDVVPLNPDMVVTYNGFNELADIWADHFNGEFPFLNHFQKDLFSAIVNIKKTGYATKYTFGLDSKCGYYMNWKNSVIMMHLICEGYGIKYISVLQPNFYNQVENLGGKSDKEILMHMGLSDKYRNEMKRFFDERDHDKWHPNWLKDLRTIFHGIDNVYYDTCHVWEKGNEIIADKMLEFVKESLLLL